MTPDSNLARRAAFAILAAFAFTCLYFTGVFPPFANPNELSRFQTVVAMAEGKTFAIDEAVALLGDHEDKSESGGRFYSNKAPGLAFAAYPVYRLLRLALPAPRSGTADAIFWLTRLLTVSTICGIALRRFLVRVSAWAGAPSAAPLATLAVAFGTPFLFYARSFFSHAWAAALLFLAWDRLRRSEEANGSGRGARTAALAGFLAAWAAISEYTVAPIALALAARAAAGRSGRRLAAFGAAAAVPLALLGIYDAICFGSPWTLSSAREASAEYAQLSRGGAFGFGLPSPKVAFSLLLDPARGVLLFSPFLVWSFVGIVRWWRRRTERADWWFLVAGLGVFFVTLCGYANWHGGWSLGSRYLLPGILLAALPIARALDGPFSRGLFFAATVFSVALHLLLTASWPHFPPEMAWPAVSGSLWFLERGWAAPNLGMLFDLAPVVSLLPPALRFDLGPLVSLLPPTLVTVWAMIATGRAARPVRPAIPVAVLLGAAPLVALALRPPEPPYFGRLWRAGVYGAFSGRDGGRTELSAVVLEARTPDEKRLALRVWRWLGPR